MAKKKPVRDGSFAKLFGKGADQILVFKDDNDDCNPCIKFMVSFGGSSAMSVASYEEGDYEKRDEIFAGIDEVAALKVARPLRASLSAFTD